MNKVSVVVPGYNVEDYIRECLDSVLGQTLKEIEVVCVNDGSVDGTSQIMHEYEKKDSRVVVVDKLNGGLSSARNAGIKKASGEYLLFVNPKSISKMIGQHKENILTLKKLGFDCIVKSDNLLDESSIRVERR